MEKILNDGAKLAMRDLTSEMQDLDLKWENKLRPHTFEEFPGQKDVKEKMKVFVQAASKRGSP